MKNIIICLISFFAFGAQAEIVTIDLKEGTNYVNLSWSYMMTGCSGSETTYSVILSSELGAYVVGTDIAVPAGAVVPPTPLSFPQPPICQAEFLHTSKARFRVFSYEDHTIEVVVPENYFAGAPKVVVENTPALPLFGK